MQIYDIFGILIEKYLGITELDERKNKMEERTLRIPNNPQYGVIVEDPKNIKTSLFFDVYV